MNRRTFVFGLGAGILAVPLATDAQSPAKVHRIGFLCATSPSDYAGVLEALREGLRDLGYVEGKNIAFEYRWAEGKYDRLSELATELVQLKVDLIVTHGTPGTLAAKRTTATVPIVMAIVGDAVGAGIVASFARPGGNITGSSYFFTELGAKRVELLKKTVPRASRLAVLLNPDNQANAPALRAMEPVAKSLKVELQLVEMRGPDELETAFSTMVGRRAEAVVVFDDAMLRLHRQRVADLAAKKRLPSIGYREYVEAGGLMSYGVNFPEVWRRAAVFVDKILNGAKPADMPVEQVTRFELVINLKTAKALGLTIPPSLLLRADQVIE